MAKKGTIGDYSQAKLNKIINDKITINDADEGDVTGPDSSTDNAITRFDGTGGKTLQNSGCTIDDSNNMTVAGQLTGSSGASITGLLSIAGFAAALGFGNSTSISSDITTPDNYNSVLFGPITISVGNSLRIGSNSSVKIKDISDA